MELGHARTVVLSVVDETGVSYVMDILLENCKSKDTVTRRGAVTLLAAFCDQTKVDISEYVPQLLRALILLFTDTEKVRELSRRHNNQIIHFYLVQGVLTEAHNALTAVTKSLEPGQQMTIVPDIRQAVRFAAADLKEEGDLLPGFCLPKVKSLSPSVPQSSLILLTVMFAGHRSTAANLQRVHTERSSGAEGVGWPRVG